MYAGILYGAAFVAAWIAIFLPHVLKDRGKFVRALLVAIVAGALVINVQFVLTGPLLLATSIALAVAAFEVVCLFKRANRTFVPALSGLYAIFTIPTTWKLATSNPRNLGLLQWDSLLWAHFLLWAVFLILSVILWLRFFSKSRLLTNASILASFLTCLFGTVALILTIPWSGGEATMLWFFVVIPLFVFAAIVLSSTCLWILTIRRRRHAKMILAGQTPEPPS